MDQRASKILSFGRAECTTDRTRRSVELAVQAADEMGDTAIDSCHLLCGLFREGHGIAYHVLDNLGLTHELLNEALSSRRRGSADSAGKDVLTAMNAAVDGYTRFAHRHFGTEHVLLGVVADGTQSASLLSDLKIAPEAVVHEVLGLTGHLQ